MKPRLSWRRLSRTLNKWDKSASFLIFIMLLTGSFIIVCLFIINETPNTSSTMTPIVYIAVGLMVVEFITLIIMLILSKRHNKAMLEEAERAKAERSLRIPKHSKIGDDGEIVELKKPRKRSKNPHQR